MKVTPEIVKEENIKVYKAEAETYDLLHPEVWNWYEQKRYNRLVNKTLRILPKKSEVPVIVDVGTGTGNLTLKYLAAGCRVICIDISKEILQVLKRKLHPEEKERCTIICADVESVMSDVSALDGVCFSSVLHHLYNYQEVIERFVGKMRPGGFFFNIHDPLIQTPKSQAIYRLHRMVGKIDESLFRWNTKRLGYRLEDFPDDKIAEYHQREGTMNHIDLKLFLEKLGLLIVHYETYTSRRYGLFGWLATEIIGSENAFTYIAKKP